MAADETLPPWSAVVGGLTLAVRATPRGGRDAIEGIVELSDGRRVVKARVAVAAEDGKANAALAKLVAKAAGVPASAVSLTHGATARLKIFHIAGDPAALAARLGALLTTV
ncbi:DUF167 family protein [Ancylobacter sp. 6x-1]|uniref:UPF0235 protein MWN34_11390 n=1 Tax=Ancylobacter crimeensis TaxID=2579147 RepID=A0ABT0DC34_9HYPH|nr:DUF167 family protein [Ancylobacter crimeensis]MCK0197518.1 DUF167 family protein [Ancylobacter crimeensis]